ncbi:phosphoadenosine phosphosulfate reductase domain-containing protein [Paenibacillus silvae]|uniref:phosphoadenosine phosphosulfate reductase domain-containing protein n=1 Tax=Paenibacillus silvae TaxID=1325358 RepID=UPI00166DA8CB
MPNLTCEEWKLKIRNAAFTGENSSELANKALPSLDRLPELEPGQKVCASYSNGKDSQGLMILATMKYPKDKIMALFADTKDEWPETYAFQPIFESWIGIHITTLESEGIHKMLRHRIPFWPMMKRRHCTNNCKMIPQRDYLDQQGYDKVRLQGRAKNPPKAKFRNGELLDVKYPAPVMLCGERWYESTNRAELSHDSRDDVILRYPHRPVLEFND